MAKEPEAFAERACLPCESRATRGRGYVHICTARERERERERVPTFRIDGWARVRGWTLEKRDKEACRGSEIHVGAILVLYVVEACFFLVFAAAAATAFCF